MFSESDANFTGITEDEQIFVNDFKQTTVINMNCKKVQSSKSIRYEYHGYENDGFKLDSPFVYIVFDAVTELPLLIGKFSDPDLAKDGAFGKEKYCKTPDVENGFIQDDIFQEKILPRELVDEDTPVGVICNSGYSLEMTDFEPMICKSWGWNAEFPKCKSNNLLL